MANDPSSNMIWSITLCICLLPIHPPIYLFICLFTYYSPTYLLFTYRPIYLYLFNYLPTYITTYVFHICMTYLLIYPPTYILSTYLFIMILCDSHKVRNTLIVVLFVSVWLELTQYLFGYLSLLCRFSLVSPWYFFQYLI
jgi:hypothetical protein